MSKTVCKCGPCCIRGMSNCQFLDLGTTKFASLAVLIIAPGWSALLSHVQVAQGWIMCPRFAAMVGCNDIPWFLQVNGGIVPRDTLWTLMHLFLIHPSLFFRVYFKNQGKQPQVSLFIVQKIPLPCWSRFACWWWNNHIWCQEDVMAEF